MVVGSVGDNCYDTAALSAKFFSSLEEKIYFFGRVCLLRFWRTSSSLRRVVRPDSYRRARMDIPRHFQPLASSSTSSPIPLPGLISSLKPIKRLTSQLAEESLLLRRFTYKNKNQHKANGWWRKIVEVDRVMSRLGDELDGVLGGFGVG